MKKHFLTGLATLLPLVLTVMIFMWIVNFLTKPFMGLVEPTLQHFDLDRPFGFLNAKEVVLYTSRLLILLFLVLITLGIGFLLQLYVLHQIVLVGDWILRRIPFVGSVYKSSSEVITRIFKQEKSNFKQVVLVPFPHDGSMCLAFITNEVPLTGDRVTVFVPGVPNPLMGFLLQYPRHQVIKTEVRVDDAIRFMVSCGALSPDRPVITDGLR
ncbi:MAG: DUF502 domain-containing protein [Chlamydiales bacterium]|nr:DUF502 domain-containing protein [Chlamydiales bacterium]